METGILKNIWNNVENETERLLHLKHFGKWNKFWNIENETVESET